MRRRTIIGGLMLAVFALWVVFMVSMRMKFQPVQRTIRRMNRAVINPRAMESAGQPGAYASVVQHLGRTTGTAYETPVQVLATDDGFVIPLPYGTAVDWLQNVLAQGSAVIVHEGNTYQVDRSEVVPSAVAMPHVPSKYQWSLRMYGVDQFVRVRRVEPQGTQDHSGL
jgi:hypothetical protein